MTALNSWRLSMHESLYRSNIFWCGIALTFLTLLGIVRVIAKFYATPHLLVVLIPIGMAVCLMACFALLTFYEVRNARRNGASQGDSIQFRHYILVTGVTAVSLFPFLFLAH